MTPILLARASLIILALLGILLVLQALKIVLVPVWMVVGLLLLRLASRLYSAYLTHTLRSSLGEAIVTGVVCVLLLNPRLLG